MNQMHNLQPHGMGMSPMLQGQQPSPQQQHLQQQQLMQGGIVNQVPTMVHPQQQQQQQQQPQQQQAEKIDNITKIKSLVVPLRESLLVNTIERRSN